MKSRITLLILCLILIFPTFPTTAIEIVNSTIEVTPSDRDTYTNSTIPITVWTGGPADITSSQDQISLLVDFIELSQDLDAEVIFGTLGHVRIKDQPSSSGGFITTSVSFETTFEEADSVSLTLNWLDIEEFSSDFFEDIINDRGSCEGDRCFFIYEFFISLKFETPDLYWNDFVEINIDAEIRGRTATVPQGKDFLVNVNRNEDTTISEASKPLLTTVLMIPILAVFRWKNHE